MDSTGQLASDSSSSVIEGNINCPTESRDLCDGDGRHLEKAAPGVFKNNDQVPFFSSKLFKSTIKMVMLNNQIRKILNTANNENFNQESINGFASDLLKNDFLFYIELFLETTQFRIIENRIKMLLMRFDDTKSNIVYLSSYLVSIFGKITERYFIPPNELKFKLNLFIDVILVYIKKIDDALRKKWFSYDAFMDWICFMANVIMPKDRYVSVNEENVIENAYLYFSYVSNSRYTLFDNLTSKKIPLPDTNSDCILRIGQPSIRKYEENPFVQGGNIKRIKVTKRNNVIDESRKRLRRLLK
ncbi:Hypothetical protein CINCED_3A023287 [Cinara cedri]|uniref:Uncharacterized protein n=1 Tax=Cinara cedri TaxID=506608 RepID=A0A5E4MAG9_9HEMI|nr:Hypothetical protein CINCED_3A023287 [Cinara cedri]